MLDIAHPIFASFVFPLLFLTLIFEIISYFHNPRIWRPVVSVTLICISLFSFMSYYSGFNEYESLQSLNEEQKILIENHQALGKFYLIMLFPTLVFGIMRLYNSTLFIHLLFIPFFIATILLAGFTSHKGGALVFHEGIGVLKKLDNR